MALTAAQGVAAQRGQDGALAGFVTDASGAILTHVTVSVSSERLIGGTRTTETDTAGRYRLALLPPGTYDIEASLAGFKTMRQPSAVVPAGLAITVDFELPIAPVPETVIVAGAPPMMDFRSSSSPVTLDRNFLDNLPLDRNVSGYVNLAPGVARDAGLGGSAFANPVSLDGASANEPGWGTPTSPLTRSWIEEIQIVGPGADAQYGEYTGVSLNAITRSGSNRFAGSEEVWLTRHNWVDVNRGALAPALRSQFRGADILERWEGIVQVGGPVFRDRLWFFSGGDHYRNDTRPAGFSSRPRTADEPRAASTEQRAIGKLTAAIATGARLESMVTHNRMSGRGTNASPLVLAEALSNTDRLDDIANVRVGWTPTSHTVVEARSGGNARRVLAGPPQARRDGPAPHLDLLSNVQSGNAQIFNSTVSRVVTGTAALTYYRGYGAGLSHELKVGAEREWARTKGVTGYPGGRLYLDFDGAADQVEFWGGATYRGRHDRSTAYAQDSWSLARELTLNAGVRLDVYRSAPPYPGRFATHSIAPRVGAAWNVAGLGRTLVRGHFGRYYDPIVSSYYDFLDPLSDTPDIVAKVLGAEQFRELYRFLPSTGFALDPQISPSYLQEYLAGIEQSFGARASVTAQFIHREFRDTLSFVDTATVWQPLQLLDPGPDGKPGTADDAGLATVFNNVNPGAAYRVLTNPPQAYRHYRGVELVGSMHGSKGRELQTSYTWSRTVGNFNNAFSSNAANNDNSINGVFVNPNRAINNTGRTALDARHVARVMGTAAVPWGRWTVSGIYRYESGSPWGRVVVFTSGLNQGFDVARVEPRVRRTPATNAADLRIGKTVRVHGWAVTELFGDVVNVTNSGRPRAFVERSGPQFGRPAAWTEPRTLRLGIRLTF